MPSCRRRAEPSSERHGVDVIVETARARPGEITLVTLGPLTNLAVALEREPALPRLLAPARDDGRRLRRAREHDADDRMEHPLRPGGGADRVPRVGGGVAADPTIPRPLALGLDVTERARIGPEHVVAARATGRQHAGRVARPGSRTTRSRRDMSVASNPVIRFIADALRWYYEFHERYDGFYGAFIHDPLAVAAALDPTLVTTEPLYVDVETRGELTTGMTVADRRRLTGKPPNLDVAAERRRRHVPRAPGRTDRRPRVSAQRGRIAGSTRRTLASVRLASGAASGPSVRRLASCLHGAHIGAVVPTSFGCTMHQLSSFGARQMARGSGGRVTSNDARMGARVLGRFLYSGGSKLYVRGVTYGTFRPDAEGHEYPDAPVVEGDFERWRRTASTLFERTPSPPRWLLDAAPRHGLRVMVGLPWEQHVGLPRSRAESRRSSGASRRSRRHAPATRRCSATSIGNEIPADARALATAPARIERFLRRLYGAAKARGPEACHLRRTYPSTEYLRLAVPRLRLLQRLPRDARRSFDAYLRRLQNLAGDRPLLIARARARQPPPRRGRRRPSARLAGAHAFAGGCAGTFVFAWTDEWHRGGHDIEDWDFGLTDRDRQPKPALDAVAQRVRERPVRAGRTGRASRSSSAPTTEPTRSTSA